VEKMRKLMERHLKKLNKEGISVTRLHFTDTDGKKDYVEDFSYFMNDKYMSKSLIEALKNKKELNKNQKDELETFIIEKEYKEDYLIAFLQDLETRIEQLEEKDNKAVSKVIEQVWNSVSASKAVDDAKSKWEISNEGMVVSGDFTIKSPTNKQLVFENVKLGKDYTLQLSDGEKALLKNAKDISIELVRATSVGKSKADLEITLYGNNLNGSNRMFARLIKDFKWGNSFDTFVSEEGFEINKITSTEYILLDRMVFKFK
jgi:hypothetical protein